MKKVSILIILIICGLLIISCSKEDKSENKPQTEDVNEIMQAESELKTSQDDFVDNSDFDEVEEEVQEEDTLIIRDEVFDFEGNFEKALKAATTKTEENEKQEEENKEPVDLPPAPVSNLSCNFNWKTNLIEITWTDPADEDLSKIEIRNNKTKDVVIIPKGKQKYSFTPKGKDEHKYILTATDVKGQRSSHVGCSVSQAYLFDSFNAPEVANTGNGKVVEAEIKGINFNKLGIKESDFGISCFSNPVITRKSKIKVVDENTLSVNLTIPKKQGNYALIISCGKVKLSGYFTVKDFSSYQIGKIIYSGEVPESVIAGYDSLGYPFGLGLKEKSAVKWALENSFGYNICFNDIVSHPSVVGVDSAQNATFTGDIDGEDNWENICAVDINIKNEDGKFNNEYIKLNYPIFYYAQYYGALAKLPKNSRKGWYVPSLSELCQIYKNREKLNLVFTEIGSRTLSQDFYWSSSQNDYSTYNGCAVKFTNGSIYKFYNKGNAIAVRFVKSYK